MNHFNKYLSFSKKEFFLKRKLEIRNKTKQPHFPHPNLDVYFPEEGCYWLSAITLVLKFKKNSPCRSIFFFLFFFACSILYWSGIYWVLTDSCWFFFFNFTQSKHVCSIDNIQANWILRQIADVHKLPVKSKLVVTVYSLYLSR